MGRGKRTKNLVLSAQTSSNTKEHISPFAKQMFGKKTIADEIIVSPVNKPIKLNDKPIQEIDFTNIFMVSTIKEYDCEKYGCDYECRCAKITGIQIEMWKNIIVAEKIAAHILEPTKIEEQEKIISKKLLAKQLEPLTEKLNKEQGIGFTVKYGYAGEELDELYIEENQKHITDQMLKTAKETMRLPFNKRIEKILGIKTDGMKTTIKQIQLKEINGLEMNYNRFLKSQKTKPIGILQYDGKQAYNIIEGKDDLKYIYEQNVYSIIIE